MQAALEQQVINLQWLRQVLKEATRRDNARPGFQRTVRDLIKAVDASIADGKAEMRLELETAMEAMRHRSHCVDGPTILLQSGEYFDFLNPDASVVCIEDVAHGLSQVCRFAGQTPEFYSVAQHCVHCSEIVPFQHAYAALMHDASEAFLGDVTRPLKALLPDYRALEARVEASLMRRFNVPYPFAPEVKEADLAMLGAEQNQVMGNADNWGNNLYADVHILPWPPKLAKQRFLQRFAELTQ